MGVNNHMDRHLDLSRNGIHSDNALHSGNDEADDEDSDDDKDDDGKNLIFQCFFNLILPI